MDTMKFVGALYIIAFMTVLTCFVIEGKQVMRLNKHNTAVLEGVDAGHYGENEMRIRHWYSVVGGASIIVSVVTGVLLAFDMLRVLGRHLF